MRRTVALLFAIMILVIIAVADSGVDNFVMRMVYRIPNGDKLGHLMLFGLMAGFLNLSVHHRTWGLGKWRIFIGTCVVAVFTLIEEFTQIALQHRSFDLRDLLADALGILFFTWVFYRLERWRQVKKQRTTL